MNQADNTSLRLRNLVALLLLAAIVIMIWAVVTQRFELRRKATSAEPSICTPVGNIITVTPFGGNGTCHDLQTAVNAVIAPNYEIHVATGTYYIPETGLSHSVMIAGKSHLTITGIDNGVNTAAQLIFSGLHGGVRIDNSDNIHFEWLSLSGSTANGMLSVNNSHDVSLGYLNVHDLSAHTIDMYGGQNNHLFNCDVQSSSQAVVIGGESYFIVNNCEFHNANVGLDISSSNHGSVNGNTIYDIGEVGIRVGNSDAYIGRNTITKVGAPAQTNAFGMIITNYNDGVSQLTLQQNIIFENAFGIQVNSPGTTLSFTNNDLYGNYLGAINNYTYPGGFSGNISANPLFGTGFCIGTNSPAIYGVIAQNEYMGSKGVCATEITLTPTPTASPTTEPSPTATPTPLSPTPTVIPSVSPTPPQYPYSFDMRVRFAGVTSNQAEGTKVTVRFMNGTFDYVTPSIPVSYVTNGVYSIRFALAPTSLPSAQGYRLSIKGEKHIAVKFCRVTGQTGPCLPNESIQFDVPTSNATVSLMDFTGLPLPPGDLPPQNGSANIDDFNTIKTIMGLNAPSSSDIFTADVNYDGVVDSMDLFWLRKTLETRYDEN